MTEQRSNGITTFLAFTVGAVIGGGVALLMAPRSGAETREKIQGMVDDTRTKVDDITKDLEGRVKKAVQEGMDHMEEKADQVKEAAKAEKEKHTKAK